MALSLWSDLEVQFETREYEKAIHYLQKLQLTSKEYEDMGKSAKTMAELHLRNKKTNALNKAIGYGLASGVCFLLCGRVAMASPQLDWLQNNGPDHPESLSLLKTLLGERLSPPPRGNAKDNNLFANLSREELDTLMTLASSRKTSADEILFEEGAESDSFFIILDGQVQITSQEGLHKVFESGQFFGELGLLGQKPRTATAKCLETSHLLEFQAEDLENVFQKLPELQSKVVRFYELRTFLRAVQNSVFFRGFEENELNELFSILRTGSSKAGITIIEQGAEAKFLIFLLKGRLSVQRDGAQISVLHAGQFVGEIGLAKACPRTASVTTIDPVQYLYCDQKAYDKLCDKFPKFKTIIEELAEVRSASS